MHVNWKTQVGQNCKGLKHLIFSVSYDSVRLGLISMKRIKNRIEPIDFAKKSHKKIKKLVLIDFYLFWINLRLFLDCFEIEQSF